MIDLKYHIASLVAVFLALAVGILIGSSMVGAPSVEAQIRRLKSGFDRIQAEDRKLQAENAGLRQQARVLENALRQTVPTVVRNRLAGKRVAVLVTHQAPDASLLREIKSVLVEAGATVNSITTFQANLLPASAESRTLITERTGIDLGDPERACRQLAARVTREIVAGTGAELIRVLGEHSPGLLADGEYSQPVDAVVLLATGATDDDERAMAEGTSVGARIADTLRQQKLTAVACETQASAVSLLPYFASYNLTTVDGADTPLGKIALVYALAGKQGHFGTKPSAAQVLPDLDVEPATPSGAPPARSPLPELPGPALRRGWPPPAPGHP